MKISIVIPLYNKEKSIHKSLDSIILQSFKDWECVVVDDGSSDGSCDIVNSYNDNRIKLYSKSNGGPSSARNYGVKCSIGDWIIFLDADDYFMPESLQIFADAILKYPDADCIISNFIITKKGESGFYLMSQSEGFVPNKFFSICTRKIFMRTGNTILKREILFQHPFDISKRRYEDYECFLSILRDASVYLIKSSSFVYDCNFVSASKPTQNKSIDYLYNIDFSDSSMSYWEKVYLYSMVRSETASYGENMYEIYPVLKNKINIIIGDILVRIILKLKIFIYRCIDIKVFNY